MRTAWIAIALTLLVPAASASATPVANIASSGPLKNIWIGNDLACQVAHTADSQNEVYPPSAIPGSCGTLVAMAGVLYAPDFSGHGGGDPAVSALGARTPWSPVSQTGVSGAGTEASPYSVTTVANAAATGLKITQTDTYIVNREGYRTDVKVENTSGSTLSGVVYRAADCFLQGSDQGYGFVDAAANAAGCSQNPNNSPVGRIEQWYPITPGAGYLESTYSSVWAAIGAKTPFNNTCMCATSHDNGAGISWNFSLPAGQSATYSHFTVFSPEGRAGPPADLPPATPPATTTTTTTTTTPATTTRPATTTPATTRPTPTPRPGPGTFNAQTPPAFGPGGIIAGLPSTRRCVSKRRFVIKIRQRRGRTYASVQVFLNRRSVATRRGARTTAPINLRGLPKGSYTVRIVVVTTQGEVITGTRRYRTCTKKQRRRGRPGRL